MTVISSLGATVPVTVSPLVLSLWYPQSDPSKFVCEFGNHLLKKPRLVIRYLIFCMSASEFTVFVYRHGLHDPLKSLGTFSLPNQTSVAANLKVDASVHWIWDFCVFVGLHSGRCNQNEDVHGNANKHFSIVWNVSRLSAFPSLASLLPTFSLIPSVLQFVGNELD